MKVLLLVLYLTLGGRPQLETSYFDKTEQCKEVGSVFLDKLVEDEKVAAILFATCVPVPAQEVKS